MELKKREEIVKDIEELLQGHCCFDYKYSEKICGYETIKDALSLIKELTEGIKDLEADYERVYEQAAADIHGNIADGGTSCHWCMDKTKTDTVRKMQDRLKERGYIQKPYGVSKVIDEYDIDQVAKEMLEENK